MKRKILLGIMAVTCASALAFGLSACGDGGNTDDGGDKKPDGPNYTPPDTGTAELLKFELNGDESGYIVTGLADGVTDASIIIPATYNNLPVIEIGDRAFGSCHNLTSVTINQGVSVIGSGAFTDCVNLPSFRFPASIKSIEDSAFQNCTGLKTLRFNDNSLLEEISANAFQSCTNLVTVSVPDSVVTIGNRVFQNCTSLKSVTIGNGVESIGLETFRGCTKLESVTIGNSLKHVDERAFLNCSAILEMHFPLSLESVGLGALSGCTGIKKLTLPFIGSEKYDEPVPTDKEYSPDNHTNFGYIFGASSFHDNYKLSLDQLETLTITGDSPIGYHAFQGIGRYTDDAGNTATGLNTIIITGNVKVFGTGAFQGCYNLQTLVIPKSVTKMGLQILDIGMIKQVYYGGTETEWNNISGTTSSSNPGLNGASRYYYSETQPSTDGKYWHYVDGVPTPW